jgi:hypothetical protein
MSRFQSFFMRLLWIIPVFLLLLVCQELQVYTPHSPWRWAKEGIFLWTSGYTWYCPLVVMLGYLGGYPISLIIQFSVLACTADYDGWSSGYDMFIATLVMRYMTKWMPTVYCIPNFRAQELSAFKWIPSVFLYFAWMHAIAFVYLVLSEGENPNHLFWEILANRVPQRLIVAFTEIRLTSQLLSMVTRLHWHLRRLGPRP